MANDLQVCIMLQPKIIFKYPAKPGSMKLIKYTSIVFLVALSSFMFTGCGPSYVSASATQETSYPVPAWAPPFSYGAGRYYYFPDVEMYYDLSDQDFVYLDGGQWLFSPVLPPLYAGFDLNNCFVVALNHSVYQPWMHHQYYVAHYPRYYYHNVYYDKNMASVRGFNENDKKPVFQNQLPANNNSLFNNHAAGNTQKPVNTVNTKKEDNENPDKKQPVFHEPQKIHYYGKNIGQPVKVQPQMRASGNNHASRQTRYNKR